MDIFAQIAAKIIKGQETIIGPVAVEQAQRVDGLQLDWEHQKVTIKGDEAEVVNSLVEVYKQLFGEVSVDVSKEAAGSLIKQLPANKLPEALK